MVESRNGNAVSAASAARWPLRLYLFFGTMSETEAQYEKDRLARRVSGDGEPFQGRLFARFVRDEAACRCDAQIGRAWVYFSGDAGGELFAGVWGEDGAAGGDGAACEGA